MGRHSLPVLVWPLAHAKWRALSADESGWSLLTVAEGPDALRLAAVQVVFEWDGLLLLRLCWPAAGWRRLWAHQEFVLLRAQQHVGLWALLRAHLARTRRRHWLG